MLKGARMPLKRQPLELRKAIDDLQHEIVNIGMTLVIPRRMRLRLRDEEPETFSPHSRFEKSQDNRVAANMVNCSDWVYLDRLM